MTEEELVDQVVVCLERAVSGQSMAITLDTLEEADAAFRIANDWIEKRSVTDVKVTRPGQGRRLIFEAVDD